MPAPPIGPGTPPEGGPPVDSAELPKKPAPKPEPVRPGYEEVTDEEAEHLLDYLVGNTRTAASLLMKRHGL